MTSMRPQGGRALALPWGRGRTKKATTMDTNTPSKRLFYWVVSVHVNRSLVAHGICGSQDEAIQWIAKATRDGLTDCRDHHGDIARCLERDDEFNARGYRYSVMPVMVTEAIAPQLA